MKYLLLVVLAAIATSASALEVVPISRNAQATPWGDLSPHDIGTFQVIFDVSNAEDGDVYIPRPTSGYTYGVIRSSTYNVFPPLVQAVQTTADTLGPNWYCVQEGETERFTMTGAFAPLPGMTDYYRYEIPRLEWSFTPDGVGVMEIELEFGFQTDFIYLRGLPVPEPSTLSCIALAALLWRRSR